MCMATVVLPVPGLPVKHMCRLGRDDVSPYRCRSRSISSSAAISRTRALTGASPTNSRSNSSSIRDSRWACCSSAQLHGLVGGERPTGLARGRAPGAGPGSR